MRSAMTAVALLGVLLGGCTAAVPSKDVRAPETTPATHDNFELDADLFTEPDLTKTRWRLDFTGDLGIRTTIRTTGRCTYQLLASVAHVTQPLRWVVTDLEGKWLEEGTALMLAPTAQVSGTSPPDEPGAIGVGFDPTRLPWSKGIVVEATVAHVGGRVEQAGGHAFEVAIDCDAPVGTVWEAAPKGRAGGTDNLDCTLMASSIAGHGCLQGSAEADLSGNISVHFFSLGPHRVHVEGPGGARDWVTPDFGGAWDFALPGHYRMEVDNLSAPFPFNTDTFELLGWKPFASEQELQAALA